MDVKAKIKQIYYVRFIIGLVTGGTAGFLYYYFVGCAGGTCPITSNPYISILYGMLLGGVLTFKIKKHSE